jgi:4-hydroxy-4-methyl-2-oxoglutarate aldolase
MTPPPVSAIADVLALFGFDGWLTPPLAPVIASGTPVSGVAVTVELLAEPQGTGLSPLHELVSGDLGGQVLVIAGGVGIGGAVWGEIMSRAAHRQGAVAIALDGFARDRDAMAAEGLPVYATGLAVVGPAGKASVRSVGAPVTIDGTLVAPGDHIVVDSAGAVRLPAQHAPFVLEQAARYAAGENDVLRDLAAGKVLRDAYARKKTVVTALTNLAPVRH